MQLTGVAGFWLWMGRDPLGGIVNPLGGIVNPEMGIGCPGRVLPAFLPGPTGRYE
jgi:hypothetical protein